MKKPLIAVHLILCFISLQLCYLVMSHWVIRDINVTTLVLKEH